MAKRRQLYCSVITPEQAVFEADVNAVVFPAHDGQVGVLKGRAPLLCKMGAGPLRLETAGGTQTYFVSGGFAQVLDNEITILTQQAIEPKDIDPAVANEELEQAMAIRAADDPSFAQKQHALDAARAKRSMASRN